MLFAQVDGTHPTLNLTVNQDLLSVGTLALQLGKSDVGSGVASVDIYELIGMWQRKQIRDSLQFYSWYR